MNIVIIGAGYVGLTTGLGFAKLGHRVACVDIDADKIAKLDLGEIPFYEVGLQELLVESQESGAIIFTTDLSLVVQEAQVIIFAVGTPAKSTGEANLSFLFNAAEQVGRFLDHESLMVVQTTVPVETNRRVRTKIREGLHLFRNFYGKELLCRIFWHRIE